MRRASVWKAAFGLRKAVIEDVWVEGDERLVVAVRPAARERDRSPHCRRRCPGYDLGEGRRRWRTPDVGTMLAYLEADAPRVSCKQHGVVVAAVPWARHDSSSTRSFEDQVAWLTVQASKTAVSELMRVAWRTVGWICQRVSGEALATREMLQGLTRIGVDEISIRKGQRYLTVVVDHDTGRLVWAHPGRDRRTVEKFPDLLGKDRCHQLKLVSCDRASWITAPISERCPNASVCYDPCHLVALATDALEEIRREVWNSGSPGSTSDSPRVSYSERSELSSGSEAVTAAWPAPAIRPRPLFLSRTCGCVWMPEPTRDTVEAWAADRGSRDQLND